MNEVTRHAHRVDAVEHAPDDAVLPGRVEALQHEQDAPAVLGVEPVLELVDPLDELLEAPLAVVLVDPEPVVRPALRDPRRAAGVDPQLSSIAPDSRLRGRMADRGSFRIGYEIDPATGSRAPTRSSSGRAT